MGRRWFRPLGAGGMRVNRTSAIGAVTAVSLLAAACSSGPNLTADEAVVTQAQRAVNIDRAALDRLQQESKVILCVAGQCPSGVGAVGSTTQTPEIDQAHQRLETAFLKLDAAKARLSFDESGNR
jgi:hypothetical protein